MMRPRLVRSLLWGLAGVSVLLVGAGALLWAALSRPSEPETIVFGVVPDFSLVERSGRTITRADLLGKVSVVNFFYTRCSDSCPLQSAHLARLQADLAGVPDVLLVSVTVDPDHDDRDALASYASRFGADPRRWLFLTGPRQDIYRLAVDGFHLAVVTSRRFLPEGRRWSLGPARAWAHEGEAAAGIIRLVHASRFALVDRKARILGYFEGSDWTDVERLRGTLARLVGSSPGAARSWRRPDRERPAMTLRMPGGRGSDARELVSRGSAHLIVPASAPPARAGDRIRPGPGTGPCA